MTYQRMHNYPIGSVVLRAGGAAYVKTNGNGWMRHSRHIAELSSKVIGGGHELAPNEKVFHRDCTTIGQDDHDEPENLIVVKHNVERVKFVKSRVLFIPNISKKRGVLIAA